MAESAPKKTRKSTLSAEERSLRGSAAVLKAHAKHGTQAMTAKACQAAHVTRYEDEVDPDRVLSPDERAKRVEYARRAHMKSLSFKAAKARRLKAAQK